MGKTFRALKEKDKKEIELIEQQKRDNKILELSSFEVMCLFIISLFTNFSLLVLFLSPIFPTKVLSNYKLMVFSFVVSTIFVTLSYRYLATKLINFYMKSREPKEGLASTLGKPNDECEVVFREGIHKESFYFAIFAINSLYLVCFLAAAAYLLRPYVKGNHQIYSSSCGMSSLTILLLTQLVAF